MKVYNFTGKDNMDSYLKYSTVAKVVLNQHEL